MISKAPPPGDPAEAYEEGLLSAADRTLTLCVVEAGLAAGGARGFGSRFPARYSTAPVADLVSTVEDRVRGGGPAFVDAPTPVLVEDAYPAIVRSLVLPRRNVKLVAFPTAVRDGAGQSRPVVRDDLATMRGLPAMTVVAPADGPATRAATAGLAERTGPAYLRLPAPGSPTVTDGTFAVGRASELRAGQDLTILALGPTVAAALSVAEELGRVGVSVRVLDVASVKPFDEAAVLRAARDTGAILVVEAAPTGTGVGTLVAAMTAENAPVPVRRLGFPDLWPPDDAPGRPDELGVSLERLRDEAWELLRLRGRLA